MTPNKETVAEVRRMVAEAQAKGLNWNEMRANAHKRADSIGMEIAACITSPNDMNDGAIAKLAAKAEQHRAQYAAFLDIWFKDCKKEDER